MPNDRVLGFSLIIGIAIISSLVIPMNIYRIKSQQNKTQKIGASFFGSVIGASAGACSCGPVGFAIISTFGTIGGTATAFFATYEIPMRLASLLILGYIYYVTAKSLTIECRVNKIHD